MTESLYLIILSFLLKRFNRDSHHSYNHKQLQDIDSSSCGWFVIAFLRFMHQPEYKNILFESFINLFSSDTKKNELILKTLLR